MGMHAGTGTAFLLCLVLNFFSIHAFSRAESSSFCRITRSSSRGARREGHNEYRLRVEGDPQTYQAGSTYRVSLYASSPSYFRGFTLIALKEGREGSSPDDYAGHFEIIDKEDSQFMSNCPPAVTETIPRRRSRIQVFWTAPPSGSGCVILKVSVVQRKIISFQDEGSLTRRLCEKDPLRTTEKPLQECCACGTAKYRLTFYGNWSEKMHPKDYPRRANHWSALIGASHTRNYVLWEYGGYASEGVRQVAELGSPVKMEEEIRQKGDDVMTVIKTKAQWPAWQPLNIRAAPSAEFSVDRSRHLMSFLTMLGPSPDWNVGLSAEDLCTSECGWVQRLTKDLLPWDAGTDSGHSYESPNKPTVPQERIRPLTSLDHPQSPFYDPSGGPITPLARVLVERIARKGEQCNTVPDTVDDIVADIPPEKPEEGDNTPETCIYSNWSPWSACSSSTCAKGLRMRQRMLKAQLDAGVPCPHTQDFEPCMAPGCIEEEASPCMLSEWISWSPCSATCGMGMRSRERYVKVFPEDGSSCREPTEETEKCVVNEDCSPSSCIVTEWADWEPCSVSCGVGMKKRARMMKMPASDGSECQADLMEVDKCMMPECNALSCMVSEWSDWGHCSVTCGVGMHVRRRMLKTPALPGQCPEQLEQAEKCMMPECPVDCMMSEWTEWTECNKSCGKGHMIRTRMVKLEPQFGGIQCPETIQRKKCKIRKCTRGPRASDRKKAKQDATERRRLKVGRGSSWTNEEIPGCKLGPWSSWADCTKQCDGGIQQRVRPVRKKDKGKCRPLKENRVCNEQPC
ncbi:spondin-1b isoform X2 [Hemibagrus wyckioides]|uniref:spondin-1b isoform X2 n=1 Tax=Hemibagrus wyckioides TaxID=337641 RepID=UPI00266BD258|nr:spondin-1b isoform X2 [Hemibagrus wyckioides]